MPGERHERADGVGPSGRFLAVALAGPAGWSRSGTSTACSFLRREPPATEDPQAPAAVSHYGIMRDFSGGAHPHEVDTVRFLRALTKLVVPEGQDVAEETSVDRRGASCARFTGFWPC